MKKLFAILLTVSFFLTGSAINSTAEEPIVKALDRNAVWTKWYGEENAQTSNETMEAPSVGSEIKATGSQIPMEKGRFDFLNETKFYDARSDVKNSA